MDAFIHRSQDRGHVNIGWLESKHSFSLAVGITLNISA